MRSCPNGPDEDGLYPCDPGPKGSCTTCGWLPDTRRLGAVPRALGSYGAGTYHRRSPLLLAHRIRHYFTGPRRGCSCTRCFHHPRRRIPPREIYDDRVRLAKLEAKVRKLKQAARSE